MNFFSRYLFLLFFTLVFMFGCSTLSFKKFSDNPKRALTQICEYGSSLKEVNGFVKLKMSSKEVSGQFSGAIKASQDQGLEMVITHLFGGTVAEIKVRKNAYMVHIPSDKRVLKGEEQWGGIPLRWSTQLMIGRFPCPDNWDEFDKNKGKVEMVQKENRLEVTVKESQSGVPLEVYQYELKQIADEKVWPRSLKWKKVSEASEIEFEFFDPEDQTGSPLRWEARSRQGDVKVQWQDRKSVPHNTKR